MHKNKFIFSRNTFFYLFFTFSIILSFIIFYSYYGTSTNHIPYGDSLYYDYPNRFIINNAFRNGIYPLWDQWVFNGMPSSMKIDFYNISPIVFVTSFFGNYSLTMYTFEVFLVQLLCFLGMFFWLKLYVNRWNALFGAFCFSICPQIITTIPEENPLTTMCLIPFLAYSLKMMLHGSKKNIGLFALFLLIIFSTGYLGLNILFLPIIFLFVYAEFFFVILTGTIKCRLIYLVKASVLVLAAILLFIGITNLDWLQLWSFTKLSLNSLRWGAWSPFTGANNLKIIYTLFFVNNFPPYVPAAALIPNGNTYMLYIGIFNLCLLLYALFHKKYIKISLLILIFIIFTFAISLNSTYITGMLATKFIPFLQLSRWHGWYNSMVDFFMITLSCIGLGLFYEKYNKIQFKKLLYAELIVLILIIYAIIKLISKSFYTGDFFILQILCLLVLIFISLFSILKYNSIKKFNKIYIIVPFILIGLSEYIPNSFHYFSSHVTEANSINTKDKKFITQLNENARYNFSYTSNNRSYSVDSLVTKIPTSSLEYSVLSTVSMYHLRNSVGEKTFLYLTHYIFYFPDTYNKPIATLSNTIRITKFEPNTVSALINSAKSHQKLIWSSSYTPDWKLFVNGIATSTSETAFGFTTFTLQKGKNAITLIYQPYYLSWSIAVQILSISIMIFLLVSGIRWKGVKKYRLPSKKS